VSRIEVDLLIGHMIFQAQLSRRPMRFMPPATANARPP
jgi:hypothetical protein